MSSKRLASQIPTAANPASRPMPMSSLGQPAVIHRGPCADGREAIAPPRSAWASPVRPTTASSCDTEMTLPPRRCTPSWELPGVGGHGDGLGRIELIDHFHDDLVGLHPLRGEGVTRIKRRADGGGPKRPSEVRPVEHDRTSVPTRMASSARASTSWWRWREILQTRPGGHGGTLQPSTIRSMAGTRTR